MDVTDEMITRYLSGAANPEEETAVLDHFSQSDQHLHDLLVMTAAVEQFGDSKPHRRTRTLWPAISAAASVALIIGLGITFWQGGTSGKEMGLDPSPAFAQMDSLTYLEKEAVL